MNVNYVVVFVLCCSWLSVSVGDSSSCSKDDSKPCAADEYFDVIPCLCSRCSDLCALRPDKSTSSECQHNCPDFYKQTDFPRHSLGGKESSLGTTSVAQPQVHEDNALVKKPLFWTSVISVFISVVATIILVVLCTCKKARSVLALRRIRRTQLSQTRMPAQGANKKGESFTDMLRAVTDANDPLLSSEKNFSKEKCGETFGPLVSHPMAMDSCALVHETITCISRCESSCLHRPCVASFKDSGFRVNCEELCVFSVADHDRASTTSSTMTNSGVISTTKNAVTCTDASICTADSRKSENIDSSLCIQGLDKPSEAIERSIFESGYFNSGSAASIFREEPSVGCTIYTVSVASGLASEKEIEMPSSSPIQETHAWKDEGNGSADWKCYMEILPASRYESKTPNNWSSFDRGEKQSLLTSLHKILDSESTLQVSSEETVLKTIQPDTNCVLNNTLERVCSASHKGRYCDRYVHKKDWSVQELERVGNGKRLLELNLRMRSNGDSRAVKSEPCVFNLEVRGLVKDEVVSNDEDTVLKMQKLNTYPKNTEAERLLDASCVPYMDV